MARYLGLDLSLSSPGFAVVEVRNRQASLLTATHVKTDAKEGRAQRYEVIEAFTLLFLREHKPFDAIIRESYPPDRRVDTNATIFGAWSAVDRALGRYGYAVDEILVPSTIKKTLTGDGKADKAKVADSVRKYLRLPDDYAFGTDDESDAAAVVLAWLIREGMIDK
jgi:crossover junction endodeoxyribonuclease RuvC